MRQISCVYTGGGGGGEELSTKLLKKLEQNRQKTWRLKEDECTLWSISLISLFFPWER